MVDLELNPERERVAAAARQLAAEGLVIGSSGNVSLRARGYAVVTPTGAALATLEAADTAVVELDGRSVPGSPEPTSEIDLHLGAMLRYGAGAVVHTHSPAATAMACVVDEVPVVHYAMLALGGAVPVAPYRTFGTPELAEVVLEALDGRRAALMASHGAVVFAGDLEEAVELALLLEWACDLYARRWPSARRACWMPRPSGGRRRRARARIRTPDDARRSSPSACTCSTCSCGPSRPSPRARAASSSSRSAPPPRARPAARR